MQEEKRKRYEAEQKKKEAEKRAEEELKRLQEEQEAVMIDNHLILEMYIPPDQRVLLVPIMYSFEIVSFFCNLLFYVISSSNELNFQ